MRLSLNRKHFGVVERFEERKRPPKRAASLYSRSCSQSTFTCPTEARRGLYCRGASFTCQLTTPDGGLTCKKESGSIEQDADVVMFVFREEYYLANKEPRAGTPEYEKWQLDMSLVHGKAEVIIGKQRHGPTGTVELQFEASLTRFGDLAQDSHVPERAY
jgi:hypothetical protein